jgi:hypothetical protein
VSVFRKTVSPLVIALMLVACDARSPPACADGTGSQTEIQLFFGRGIAGRPPLTDDEWHRFAESILTPAWPDGFTVYDGEGQWRDPRGGQVIRESTKVVLVVAPSGSALAGKVQEVTEAFKQAYRQQSVGIVTNPVCASF